MSNIYMEFCNYLASHFEVSDSTSVLYSQDVNIFINFLANRGKALDQIVGEDFNDFFCYLVSIKHGFAATKRKSHALKILCNYLAEVHGYVGLAEALNKAFKVDFSFPFLYSESCIKSFLDQDLHNLNSHKALKVYIITSLLYSMKLSIQQVVELCYSHICLGQNHIKILYDSRSKSLTQSRRVIRFNDKIAEALKKYRLYSEAGEETDYIFFVRDAYLVKPSSTKALIALLRSSLDQYADKFQRGVYAQQVSLYENSRAPLLHAYTIGMSLDESEFLNEAKVHYKNKHPRF